MVEHVLIPDDGLHEPKGVAGASSGTVYTANGSGSGAWTTPPYPTNEVSAAQGHITGGALVTTFTATGPGEEVLLNLGTSFVEDEDITSEFTVSTAGRLTYTGDVTGLKHFSANITCTAAGAAPVHYRFFFAKNGVVVESSVSKQLFDGTNPNFVNVSSVISVEDTDYVELYVQAVTDIEDLTLDTLSLKAFGVYYV